MAHEYTDAQLANCIKVLVALARKHETGTDEDVNLLIAARVVRDAMEEPGDITVTR